ncbi:D-sedoheptulose-7-phosphate isomerase [Marinimicrobium sp. ARAG 43.8]|uniref:D-sedoheptulose-7-phosphate isomerase n=1 Tax=Marinimicrobium sp. ARAG 43.8 TaxID=3418719 RepID=UPI003CEEDDEE
MEQRVITLFHESIEATMQTGEELAPAIARASEIMVEALLNGHKILTCGNGISAAQAQILTNCLLHRFEQERPSLPALHIGSDLVSGSAMATDGGGNDVYAKPLRAVGQEGDVLVLFTSTGSDSNLLQTISAAHERHIRVIALTGGDGGDAASLLDHGDIELRAALPSRTRVQEVHLLTLFCLCDLIDQHLFGGFH